MHTEFFLFLFPYIFINFSNYVKKFYIYIYICIGIYIFCCYFIFFCYFFINIFVTDCVPECPDRRINFPTGNIKFELPWPRNMLWFYKFYKPVSNYPNVSNIHVKTVYPRGMTTTRCPRRDTSLNESLTIVIVLSPCGTSTWRFPSLRSQTLPTQRWKWSGRSATVCAPVSQSQWFRSRPWYAWCVYGLLGLVLVRLEWWIQRGWRCLSQPVLAGGPRACFLRDRAGFCLARVYRFPERCVRKRTAPFAG